MDTFILEYCLFFFMQLIGTTITYVIILWQFQSSENLWKTHVASIIKIHFKIHFYYKKGALSPLCLTRHRVYSVNKRLIFMWRRLLWRLLYCFWFASTFQNTQQLHVYYNASCPKKGEGSVNIWRHVWQLGPLMKTIFSVFCFFCFVFAIYGNFWQLFLIFQNKLCAAY